MLPRYIERNPHDALIRFFVCAPTPVIGQQGGQAKPGHEPKFLGRSEDRTGPDRRNSGPDQIFFKNQRKIIFFL